MGVRSCGRSTVWGRRRAKERGAGMLVEKTEMAISILPEVLRRDGRAGGGPGLLRGASPGSRRSIRPGVRRRRVAMPAAGRPVRLAVAGLFVCAAAMLALSGFGRSAYAEVLLSSMERVSSCTWLPAPDRDVAPSFMTGKGGVTHSRASNFSVQPLGHHLERGPTS